ncbi:MAG: hypothetical protein DSZ09_00330 [Sulfurovum sp.]|nr:MAG: hypothetical protein DSZ08_08620 [Sulfurovum sp.]RUM73126.1 MAG: hypothetical protein DSZ09_00330 [Sulfurovum sp.]
MKNIEIYIIIIVVIAMIWLILDTIRYYRGEKRKVKNLHRFAKEGEIEAQSKLAHRYKEGNMVKQDCKKAAFWYQKAAFNGDISARGYLEEFLHNSQRCKEKKL